ncbi:MAG: phage repressor protein [Paracoccus sp. (in: a-proteobacteria)]|nr:phage repressor protein [Paracoccus sp. (in: a-proteobacteria)]
MEVTFKMALERALLETGRSLRSVAMASGVSYEQLKNLKQGKAKSTNVDDAIRVASAFGVTLDALYAGNLGPQSTIPVLGCVGAGALVPLIDADEPAGGMFRVGAPEQLIRRGPALLFAAVQVEGDSMLPQYQSGDILFYSRATHEGVLEEDIGRPCVVACADGNAWVKLVRRGDEPGLFHLLSLNPTGDNMHNRQIKWAARVIFALPDDMVERV